MFSKKFFNDAFFKCNYTNLLYIYLVFGVILLIFRQFELTYSLGVNKYLHDLKQMFSLLPWFCLTKSFYDRKMFIMAYFVLFFPPLVIYFINTPAWKNSYLGKRHANYLENDPYGLIETTNLQSF